MSKKQNKTQKFHTEQSTKEALANILAQIAYERYMLGHSEIDDMIEELAKDLHVYSDMHLCELSERELDDVENATYFYEDSMRTYLSEKKAVSKKLMLACERSFVEVERYHSAIIRAQDASKAYASQYTDLALSLDD